MNISVARNGGDNVTVTVSQANGAESLSGTCRASRDGASVNFSGGVNNGSLTISASGRVSGVVAGYSFTGAVR